MAEWEEQKRESDQHLLALRLEINERTRKLDGERRQAMYRAFVSKDVLDAAIQSVDLQEPLLVASRDHWAAALTAAGPQIVARVLERLIPQVCPKCADSTDPRRTWEAAGVAKYWTHAPVQGVTPRCLATPIYLFAEEYGLGIARFLTVEEREGDED